MGRGGGVVEQGDGKSSVATRWAQRFLMCKCGHVELAEMPSSTKHDMNPKYTLNSLSWAQCRAEASTSV